MNLTFVWHNFSAKLHYDKKFAFQELKGKNLLYSDCITWHSHESFYISMSHVSLWCWIFLMLAHVLLQTTFLMTTVTLKWQFIENCFIMTIRQNELNEVFMSAPARLTDSSIFWLPIWFRSPTCAPCVIVCNFLFIAIVNSHGNRLFFYVSWACHCMYWAQYFDISTKPR